MKTILKFGIAFCLASTVSYAARDWDGKLIDADCYNKNPSTVQTADHRSSMDLGKACMPTLTTTAYAFQSADSGRVYKLDENSNAIVEKGIADGVLKPSKSDGEYRVFVHGSHKTGVMVVNGIQPRKYRNSAEY